MQEADRPDIILRSALRGIRKGLAYQLAVREMCALLVRRGSFTVTAYIKCSKRMTPMTKRIMMVRKRKMTRRIKMTRRKMIIRGRRNMGEENDKDEEDEGEEEDDADEEEDHDDSEEKHRRRGSR